VCSENARAIQVNIEIKARVENGVLNLELSNHEQTKTRQISIDQRDDMTRPALPSGVPSP
jgi:hypothetical protein